MQDVRQTAEPCSTSRHPRVLCVLSGLRPQDTTTVEARMRLCANCRRDLANVSALRDLARVDLVWCDERCCEAFDKRTNFRGAARR